MYGECRRWNTTVHSYWLACWFQGMLDGDDGWSVDAHQLRCCDSDADGGQFVPVMCRTPGPSYCCSCRRVDCVDLLRRTGSTSDVSPERVASEDLQLSIPPRGDEARSLGLCQQRNSTQPATPHPSNDVTVTPIWRHIAPPTTWTV